jgi:hypothetical protein
MYKAWLDSDNIGLFQSNPLDVRWLKEGESGSSTGGSSMVIEPRWLERDD